MDAVIFRTQRERLLEAWADEGKDFLVSTMPYHSVASLKADVVDVDLDNGVAWAVFNQQELSWFDFGRKGTRILLGANAQHVVNQADTNLTKPSSTNGASDFVIEGIGLHQRAVRCQYAEDAFAWGEGNALDPAVVAALLGHHPICDPGSHVVPPQFSSPFNLENAPLHATLPFLSLTLNFDQNTIKPLGCLDMLPQAGGASLLRANGLPDSGNRFRIDEGYIWRRDGMTDGEFHAVGRLHEAVTVPIDLLTPPNGGEGYVAPVTISLDLVLRVFGIEVEGVNQN